MKKQYVTIGTPAISKNIFRNILRPANNFSFKPSGGLWACDYSEFILSSWYYYLVNKNPGLQCIKNAETGVIFTLKNSANILNLNNGKQIIDLAEKYPSYHHLLGYHKELNSKEKIFDFEEISRIYDGIYVDYYNISFSKDSVETFKSWELNTLLLFNLDCIDSYKKIEIRENKDFEAMEILPEIKSISSEKHIKEKSPIYNNIYEYIRIIFNNLMQENISFIDYNNFFEIIALTINKCIEITLKEKKYELQKLSNIIKEEGITIKTYNITFNITLNYLTEYLYNNKDKIKDIPKSLIKEKKWYNI